LADQPDWTRATLLQARDAAGDIVTLLVDADGQLYSLLRGEDALGDPQTIQVDADGQLFVVLRGADGVDVAVDADGFLSAVLKGEHLGVSHTISVDAQGRIEAFILDQESQWGDVLKVGNSELASRLGSSVSWDWRGNVLYEHDFGVGMGCVLPSVSGAGAGISLDAGYWGFGGYSLKMIAGSNASHYARFQLSVGICPSATFGFAVRFSITPDTEAVGLMLEQMVGAGSPWAFVKLDVTNGQLQVYEDGTGYVNVQAVDIPTVSYAFCWIKVVIDATTGHYVRLMFNDVSVDISAYSYSTIVSATAGLMLCQFTNTGRAANNDVVYVDDIILTVNEPL